jgi:hypothetical protein
VDASGRAAGVVVLAAVALHLALLGYFLPPRLLAAKSPIFEYDYALHAYQVDRAVHASESAGRLHSYDPLVLAGQPAGAVEDLTSKSLEYFVIAAHRAGVDPWIAFNAYVALVHLALLPVAWVAARLFGANRLAAALTLLFWVLAWHLDSFLHWCWYIGMISWALASYLTVLVVALAYRAMSTHRGGPYVALAATAALVTFVHPFAVLTLVAPLGALYVAAFRRLGLVEHGALVACTIFAALTCLTWIGPALAFRHYIGPVNAFLWPSPTAAVTDSLDLLGDLAMTGEPVRTACRTVALVLAVLGLATLRREKDDRFLPLAVFLGGCIAAAYLSGLSPLLRQTQPYRHIAPATLVATLVAALFLERLSRAHAVRPSAEMRAVLTLAAFAAVPVFAKTALGYLPVLLPSRAVPRAPFRPGPGVSGSSEERAPVFMGHSLAPEDLARVAHAARALGEGRVATVDWVLGEYLATFGGLPTLGGIAERNVPHVAAHPLRHDFTQTRAGEDPLARYLTDYAVAVVVTHGDTPFLDDRVDLLEPATAVGPFHLHRVRAAPSYFATGSGRIVSQGMNSIRVADAAGTEVVLRFHFMETLRCRPRCRVERAGLERDPVGFIAVSNPPPDFEIFNAYD